MSDNRVRYAVWEDVGEGLCFEGNELVERGAHIPMAEEYARKAKARRCAFRLVGTDGRTIEVGPDGEYNVVRPR